MCLLLFPDQPPPQKVVIGATVEHLAVLPKANRVDPQVMSALKQQHLAWDSCCFNHTQMGLFKHCSHYFKNDHKND